ncbi:MAG: cytochrome c biogenesis CcdA family protein [Chitinispirillaceae bacterium]
MMRFMNKPVSAEDWKALAKLTYPIVVMILMVQVVTASAGNRAGENGKMAVHYFGSETCGECLTIRKELLEPLKEKYPDRLDVKVYDIDREQDFQFLMKMEEAYGVKVSSATELFLPDTFLIGFDDIMRHGKQYITARLDDPSKWRSKDIAVDSSQFSSSLQQKFSQFSFVSILMAGLADGVNPCAIATMIFLISFLATQKRKRSEVLVIGLSFTAAVFFTYLLMGVGAFKALSFLSNHMWISKTVKWSAVGFAGIIGVVCFRDAFVYKRSGKAKDIKLQLPKAVKMRIHRVISKQLSGTSLILGAIVTGFLVTLLEAVCTGQVYLPTIVLMTRQEGALKLTGWLYLIFYNILFVLPLLVVMIMAYYGMTWDMLSKKMQNHLVLLKVLLGSVLVFLATFLAVSL